MKTVMTIALLGLAMPALAQEAPLPGGRGPGGMGGGFAQRFAEADADHDGSVSREEFDAFRAKMRAERMGTAPDTPPPPPRAGGMDLFGMMDANHDGKVSMEEAQAAAAMMRANRGGGGRPPQ